MIHRVLDDTAHRLSIRAHILATPGLLKLSLALGFCLYHRYDLGTGLYQFGLKQHTPAAWMVLL